LGQFGQIGQIGQLGQLGQLGQIGQQGQLGNVGQVGVQGGQCQGGINLGANGIAGFGGQLGQFGNLAGQFGLQGGNQSGILINIIKQTVGKPSDWVALCAGGAAPDDKDTDLDPNAIPNSIGYYPPALALVVKAPSRIHTRLGADFGAGSGAPAPKAPEMGKLGGKDRDKVAAGPDKNGKVGNAGGKDETKVAKNEEPKKQLDPRAVWQEALEKAPQEPGLIIATADFLAGAGKWDHAAEFLKANLRQGIIVRPWVYEALAVALRESKASPEEIARVEISQIDREPQDAQGFVRAAEAMADQKRWDLALAFSRQAALLEPNLASPYSHALAYAELAKDSDAMEWAAGKLLQQDWPTLNKELHAKAEQKLNSLVRSLEGERRKESEKLLATARTAAQRDLIVRLNWTGEADLDLKVKEPTGAICSCLNRQTVGGGTLLGDTLTERNTETYVAAFAFSGEYEITVDRVWGRTLGEKAQLDIIQHQGTPQESVRRVTVDLKTDKPTKLVFQEGRRTEAASVPPPAAAQQAAVEPDKETRSMFSQLRGIANPQTTGVDNSGLRGGTSSLGGLSEVKAKFEPRKREERGQQNYQQRIAPLIGNTASLTTQAIITDDRRFVRLSVNAFFNGVTGTTPAIRSFVIP